MTWQLSQTFAIYKTINNPKNTKILDLFNHHIDI